MTHREVSWKKVLAICSPKITHDNPLERRSPLTHMQVPWKKVLGIYIEKSAIENPMEHSSPITQGSALEVSPCNLLPKNHP